MPMASATPLPSGVSPPLTTDNDNNHGGLVVIMTSLALVLVLASLAARSYSAAQRHIFQRDDLLFGILVTAYAAEVLSVLVLGFSKITSSLFYETLFSQMNLRLIRGILAIMIAWTVMSVILLAVRCSDKPWYDISDAQCSSLFPRWIAITVFDIITEILLFLYAGLAIHKIQISLQKKLMVGVTLESRILLIPLAGIRLYYVNKQIISDDPILLGAYSTITTEIYIAMSVVCLISAFLKSFIAVFEDKNGLSYTDGTSGSRSRKSKQFASASTASPPNKMGPHSSASADRLKGWEREEDPIIDQGDGRGLQILKTVHLDVRDESIELAEQGAASASSPG
ncbi:uncharacterized protein N7496_004566 [Penicillium cataractarum]|uniref:Rhodopsin domain-containing protein n=1 Tax=Penicillium cataractarum TaxID=2100454 RepID=A0A9W9VCR1_9EURO|nr:uncharacterized protein N7496_004566 [Penicillium cataractarum]KAJ5377157.1 hypothetical protein N7496_004566 [Penicillium cataractarum]